jgi:hypothetical protein
VSVRREGSTVALGVRNWTEPTTTAWLCPTDPGPGEDTGAGGETRLSGLGCLDLGTTADDVRIAGWATTIDLQRLDPAAVARFPAGGTYRLLLVSELDGGLHVHEHSADVSGLSLMP